jgi:hypothetical protein
MTSFIRQLMHLLPRPLWKWLRHRGRQLLNQARYSGLSEAECRGLNEQGLFIVGCARSGTTILCDCLNLSPDVFVLNEAHFFFNSVFGDFSSYFNRQRALESRYRAKGTYLPPPLKKERGGLAALARLGREYPIGRNSRFGDSPISPVLLAVLAIWMFIYSDQISQISK